ncbi:MAG: hypothetical protein NT031_16810, partial [Planctomycetota bacterium]|nr:hypothetical protein [Planctomycetota bacterium]
MGVQDLAALAVEDVDEPEGLLARDGGLARVRADEGLSRIQSTFQASPDGVASARENEVLSAGVIGLNVVPASGGELSADRKIRGTVKISKSARGEELLNDMADGIRKKTSMGYAIHGLRELKPEEMSDELKAMCLATKKAAFRSEDWEPVEGSSISIEADPAVGLGRSLQEFFSGPAEPHRGAETDLINEQTTSISEGERHMDEKVTTTAPTLTEEER